MAAVSGFVAQYSLLLTGFAFGAPKPYSRGAMEDICFAVPILGFVPILEHLNIKFFHKHKHGPISIPSQ